MWHLFDYYFTDIFVSIIPIPQQNIYQTESFRKYRKGTKEGLCTNKFLPLEQFFLDYFFCNCKNLIHVYIYIYI